MVERKLTPEEIVTGLKAQIALFKTRMENDKMAIETLEKSIDWILNPPPTSTGSEIEQNPKLTKDFARKYLKLWNRPVQTKQMITAFFLQADEETKSKAIKTLSVIFNTLEKGGEIKKEKKKGVKGSFYTWIKK